ncbi:MAG TPA: DUF4129 domain-containing protein [Gaiellaceae bacterium]|jgi:hypothetical protein|nr:DUF4129 domain-containing protein [Gaiellaceae bacterium]
MRRRATGVALPVLAVLLLVGVVAVASAGSTSGGSNRSRPPSDTLLDTVFSLGLVTVLAGAVLLVYGLMQRKAIAREIASGRYRRTTLVGYLAFFGIFVAFSYWRLSHWNVQPQDASETEPAFPGAKPVPSTPGDENGTVYQPSVSWIPIAVVLGLVATAVVAYAAAERRARRRRADSREDLVEQLAAVLDDTLDDLRAEADPRRAVIAAYARLERVLGANGVPPRSSETPEEYLSRVLADLPLGSGAAERLTDLFTRAKFSQHEVDATMKEDAIGALEQVRDELRGERGASTVPAREPAEARS